MQFEGINAFSVSQRKSIMMVIKELVRYRFLSRLVYEQLDKIITKSVYRYMQIQNQIHNVILPEYEDALVVVLSLTLLTLTRKSIF